MAYTMTLTSEIEDDHTNGNLVSTYCWLFASDNCKLERYSERTSARA